MALPNFKSKTFVAECYEYGNGERCIKIYHKNLTTYNAHKAVLYDPVTIFKFANWVVKAAEWVSQQKPFKAKKPNAVQPSKD